MQRVLFGLIAALLSLPLTLSSIVSAQDASPMAGGLADAGLPELAVMVTATGYEGIADQIDAGRYLVTLSIDESAAEFGGGIAFAQPPAGMTADEFLMAMMGPPDQSGVDDATPVEEPAGTPAADAGASPEGNASGIPDFVFEARYAGGTYSFGGPAQVVVDLTPGEWIAWADDPTAPQQPVIFEATGDMPADLAEPQAGATIIMGEYIIEVSEGELTTGPQVVRIDNIGAQPHFIGWFLGPEGMTTEQIGIALDEELQAGMTGTPVAYSGIDPNTDLMPLTFTATQSTNTSIWIVVDLPAGTHGLACFFPDISDGLPHAYHGMYNVVEVGE